MIRRLPRMTPWSLVWLSAACATSAPPAPPAAPVAVAPAPAPATETPSPPQRARCEPRPASEVIAALTEGFVEHSLDALSALHAVCDGACPGVECPRTDAGLRAGLRAALVGPTARSNEGRRERIIQALTLLRDTDARPQLRALILRPLAEQEVRVLRAAADALGALRDVEGAEALVYGLFVNMHRANATINCTRALVRIGADAAVPRLIDTLRPEGNPRVTQLLGSYSAVPETSPPPPGLQQSLAIDALRVFADPRGIDPLLALLRDDPSMRLPGQAHVGADVRAAAGETLAHTALTLAATDPRCTEGRGSRTASGSSGRSRAPCAMRASRPSTSSRAPRCPSSTRCSRRTPTRPERSARCADSSSRSARWPASPGTAPTETSRVTA